MTSKPKTAFVSVSDKTGIVEFAHELHLMGYELQAAGSTAKILRQIELEVEELETPEESVDIVAINLYPVPEILQEGTLSQDEILEYIDVGRSSLLRAAARRFKNTIVLCDPKDYATTLESLREFGQVRLEQRQALAAKAFFYTAYYDSTLAQYLTLKWESLPDELVIGLKKVHDFKYGENPHQKAALYSLSGARAWGLPALKLLCGKELNYNHYLDLEMAWELVAEFEEPTCVIVKHTHSCGAASADRAGEAFRLAFQSDMVSASGGIVAFNREVDEEAARNLSGEFLECVLAPDFSQKAMEILRLKKDLRLLTLPSALLSPHEIQIHSISGGLLIEDKNNKTFLPEVKTVTKQQPTEQELLALKFIWKIAKHAKSYSIVLGQGTQTVGVGAGQSSRFDAFKVAVAKSNERHPIINPKTPLVLASDGPLPLRLIQEASKIGVSAIIQPGGSAEDRDSISVCDERKMAMVFTGLRHYKH
ncbi:MAG: bifunctional phosphoribosylaminoimidazolecarboxamide formyltransferase/IMP cyclohydrolase [Elusimicrobia bacterium]|nr:bifunctional phosphoribosylaminoimidazolecarboxamide formyltransferase/IMP cyclohydrolase [Elusimicrobiota bacterium]